MDPKTEKQHVFIIRHGERVDEVVYNWVDKSKRPYDPPLTEVGMKQASQAGELFKGKDIKCIMSSPLLRCLQTAQQICNSLQLPGITTYNGIIGISNPEFNVHEQPIVPADNVADFGIKVLFYDDGPIPKFPESIKDGLKRYICEINKIADSHWPSNIIIVSHLNGVCQAVAMTRGEEYVRNVWVDYCGLVEMSRTSKDNYNWNEQDKAKVQERQP